ncbi:MAG: winged helix-turn-helix domain-containing protein [Woeseiaceae bacterium]|nr:winged helix-turn-helix domain-containing protein [Woeseiaceae bacterium]
MVTYAVACFVGLQLLDVVSEPLAIPVTWVRAAMLLMLGLAPIVVLVTALRARERSTTSLSSAASDLASPVFRIGEAEMDTARREIRFKGSAADVQPKVFDLIEYLLRNRERVIGKDELFDEIWPSVVVTEASLTQSVKRARDLFRQNGFDCDVIRTVPRKGYQFDYDVTVGATKASVESPGVTEILLPTAAVGVLAALLAVFVWNSGPETSGPVRLSNPENSLVVLPFSNLTPDPDFGYFPDGLTETLTNSLTAVRGLRVIARGSAFSFRDAAADSGVDYAAIGEALSVAHIVEGTVQRDGDQLRISARLVRADDGTQTWSRIYSREFVDIFAVQDDISRSIVDSMAEILSASLNQPERTDGGRASPADAEAYRLVLRGNEQARVVGASSQRGAEANYREALRLRPDYPSALVGLANSIRLQAVIGERSREPAFAEALELIDQVLALEPDNSDAHLQLAEIQHRYLWDFDSAAESYGRALELRPGSAVVRAAHSRFLSKFGQFARATEEARIALDLNPRSTRASTSLALRLIKSRDLDEAKAVIDTLAVQTADLPDLPWLYANWHIRNESYTDALTAIAGEELPYLRLSLTAIILQYLGREAQAREALDALIESDADGAAFQIAEVFAHWGDADNAFEWLERAFSHGDPGLAELYSSVNLENLYSDPRMSSFARQVGLPPAPFIAN